MKKIICLSLILFVFYACDKVGDIIKGDDYQKPEIENLMLSQNNINPGDTVTAEVKATNPEKGQLTYSWSSSPSGGQFIPPTDENIIKWVAPGAGGEYTIKAIVKNEKKSDDIQKKVNVQSPENPLVNILSPKNGEFFVQNNSIEVTATAYHDNSLSYVKIMAGDFLNQKDFEASNHYSFTVPTNAGMVGKLVIKIEAEAFGDHGNTGVDSVTVNVEGIIFKRGEN